MIRIVFIRHAPTPWNRAGRLQGRADVPLPGEARRDSGALLLPEHLRSPVWYASPLRRAVQTARLLSGAAPRTEAALIEMDWGEWEGQHLAALRQRHGAAFIENESRGLDFTPPGGESPRQVRARLGRWLAGLAGEPEDTIAAVTHKGVLRAALSLATGWNLCGKPPHKLRSDCAHHFAWEEQRLRLVRPNLPLWSGALYRLETPPLPGSRQGKSGSP